MPEGLSIGTAVARAGNMLLRRYNARAQGDFLKELAATRPVISPANYFSQAIHGDITWASTEKVFSKIFKRAFKTASSSAKVGRCMLPLSTTT